MLARAVAANIAVQMIAFVPAQAAAQTQPSTQSMEQILRRLDALERRNEVLARQVEVLTEQNGALLAGNAQPGSGALQAREATPAPEVPSANEWASRIRFKGDLRFRRESSDNEALAEERTRETVRARFGAQIEMSDAVEGEIAFASGGNNPRGGSSVLGAGSSRKDIGLDLAYVSWRPFEAVAVTAGKMHQPFVRPGFSAFIDNEIRPEGLAVGYRGSSGVFGSAFQFWLEERPRSADSMLTGAQAGWQHLWGEAKLTVGASYYDYGSVRGQFPGFGNGVVSEFGNTVTGEGAAARYVYDYDIGQLFAEGVFSLGDIPVALFADYVRNTAAHDLDSAYNVGVLIGKANAVGRWETGVLTQRVEKDALFGQWTDSDFAGGVTDSNGQLYRFTWMAMRSLLVNLTYFDTTYNVDVGTETGYGHWQVDFNFAF